MDGFFCKKKVGNFGEKPFVWEFLLGGDTSKKRIKKFTRKNHHGGSPAPPRVPDLVCKFSFASYTFLVAVVHLIFPMEFSTDGDLSFVGVAVSRKRGCRVGK